MIVYNSQYSSKIKGILTVREVFSIIISWSLLQKFFKIFSGWCEKFEINININKCFSSTRDIWCDYFLNSSVGTNLFLFIQH
jgi:hypothetical protein